MTVDTQTATLTQVTAKADMMLATIIDWQLDMAWGQDIDEMLADIGGLDDANACDLFQEVRWTLWAVVRTLEVASKTMHNKIDWF